ncbi:MAG: isoprenyl transferase [Deltaproteobacteria bacterium]
MQKEKLPVHIAVIMDGNGRWAKEKGLPRISGHIKGIERAREVVRSCLELGVKYLTLYTFSRENRNRPKAEVDMLMTLLEEHLRKESDTMMRDNVRFRAVGNVWELPSRVVDVVRETEEMTRKNDGLGLQLALSYSGRADIVEACRAIAKKAIDGGLRLEDINDGVFAMHLQTQGIPDPDLLIRTSGEKRVSNFLLWQIAYAELYMTEVLWPDFSKEHLLEAVADFTERERRFGLTKEQLVRAVG